MAPTGPIQLCAGCEAGGEAAVFHEGSSGEYEISERTRRVAETSARNPISSLSRRFGVGVKALETNVMLADGRLPQATPLPVGHAAFKRSPGKHYPAYG